MLYQLYPCIITSLLIGTTGYSMQSTYLAAKLGNTWNLLEDKGYDPEIFFQEAGVDPESLKKTGKRIDLNQAIELWLAVDQLFNDPCLGLQYAKYWHPSQMGALGCALVTSKSLRDALNRMVRYSIILTEGLIFESAEAADEVTVTVRFEFDHPPSLGRLMATSALAILLAMCRMNFSGKLNPQRVSFKHTAAKCASKYTTFFGTKVAFESDSDSIVFSKKVLDKMQAVYNPKMAQYADQVATEYLAQMKNANITERVKAKIVELMPSGEATVKTVAKKLYLSNRSLNRRLSEAGTTYRELLEKTRRDMVDQYLKDDGVDLRELPYLLGYKDYSSFFRAYKRWTGKSPSEMAN